MTTRIKVPSFEASIYLLPIKERNRLLPSYLRIYVNTNQIKSKSEIKYLAQYLGTFVYIITFVYPSIIFFVPTDPRFFITFFEEDICNVRRYERMKIAGGQMCHNAILTRKMRTTCVDISVLKTCSAGSTSFGGRTTRSRNPSRSASLNLTRGHTNLAITSEKGNAIHEPST